MPVLLHSAAAVLVVVLVLIVVLVIVLVLIVVLVLVIVLILISVLVIHGSILRIGFLYFSIKENRLQGGIFPHSP